MKHEAIAVLAHDAVDHLRIACRTQRGHDQCLGFATREQCAAVCTGQHAKANRNGTHGAGIATVDTGLTCQDLATHQLGFDVEQNVLDFDIVGGSVARRFCRVVHARLGRSIRFAQQRGTCLLVTRLVGRGQTTLRGSGDLCDQCFVLGCSRPFPLGLACFGNQIMNGIDDSLHLVVTVDHAAQHDFFAELLRFGFDHQHGRFGTGHDQVHLGRVQLRGSRVQHVLAIDVAHASGADRAIEGDTGHSQRGGGANHGGDIGIDFGVDGQHVQNNLHFVVEPFGKQRTQGTVNQTRRQRFFLGRLTFALEESTGDLACGIGFFDVIDRQREKILTSFCFFLGNNGGQHDGVFDRDKHGAGGLTSDFARLQCDLMLAILECFGHFVEHDNLFLTNEKPWTVRPECRTVHGCVMGNQPRRSLTQTERFDQSAIGGRVTALEIVEQLAATAHHAQQTAARVMILHVGFEVSGQLVDTSGQQCDLDFRRASVALGALELRNDFCFFDVSNGHV